MVGHEKNEPGKPEWLQHEEWIAEQPDLLVVAKEVLPYIEGILGIHEKTSNIEAYEDTNRIVQRLKGAIAKATPCPWCGKMCKKRYKMHGCWEHGTK